MQDSLIKFTSSLLEIQSLKKVKIILGNGFDVHCLAKTTYKDFFTSQNKYSLIMKNLASLLNSFNDWTSDKPFQTEDSITCLKDYNLWELYFGLRILEINGGYNPKYFYNHWCEVENEIADSLNQKEIVSFWDQFYNVLYDDKLNYLGSNKSKYLEYDIFIALIFKKIYFKKHTILPENYKKGFYSFLLKELKEFEKIFSEYINSQFDDKYLEYCQDTINALCNPNYLIAIDSFNFHRHLGDEFNRKLTNINGYNEYGFFGIDDALQYDVNDPKYIFTKSFRKTSNLIESKKFYINTEPFENVVIYGHSLNKSDFGYFFSIFDLLDLQDTKSTKKLVFAYSLYREDKEQQKLEFEISVHNILKSYCVDRKINERLIETLLSTERIKFHEIPIIKEYN